MRANMRRYSLNQALKSSNQRSWLTNKRRNWPRSNSNKQFLKLLTMPRQQLKVAIRLPKIRLRSSRRHRRQFR